MSFYARTALQLLNRFIQPHLDLFSDLKLDLKRSGMKKTLEEYLSISLFTCVILFVFEVPLLSFIFSLFGFGSLFSLFMAATIGFSVSMFFFTLFLNYPKFLIRDKSRSVEQALPFAGIYLSTIASSRLPPHKIFEIFAKFKEYGAISEEVQRIVTDMKAFGMNVYDAIERAIDRTPSNEFKDLLWAMSSTLKSGGNLSVYLSEKSKTYLNNYKMKLREFAHTLAVYLEVYLTAIVLGTIFFTILTSIMSGLGGVATTNIIFLQFILIFIFIPLVSLAFIILIKSSSPGGG